MATISAETCRRLRWLWYNKSTYLYMDLWVISDTSTMDNSFFEDGDNLLPQNIGIRLTKNSGWYPKETE